MTHTRTSHIALSYKRGRSGPDITCTYKVTKEVLRDLGLWAAGRELQAWLEKKGCKLESCDGPALVSHHADGTIYEQHYRDGKLHRDGGPALICRCADGMSYEKYYCHDRLHRDDGPALVLRLADGSSVEKYYRHDKLRVDGPAIIVHSTDGSTVENYYRDDVLVREKRRPLPRPPKTPGPA